MVGAMTAEVRAGNHSLGTTFSGTMFHRKMDHNSNLRYPPLRADANTALAEAATGTIAIKNAMGYRDTTPRRPRSPPQRESRPQPAYEGYLDDGPGSPPLPKFDYNNDRIQNDLLQEICSDIGIKDAMDLDFFDFDEFEEKKYNMNEDDACLDQVIPFGELQHQEDSLVHQGFLMNNEVIKLKEDPGLCSGLATGVPSPIGSPTVPSSMSGGYDSNSLGPMSNSSDSVDRNTESPVPRPKSEPVFINSPRSVASAHAQLSRSQSVGSPLDSPAKVPSIGSPKRCDTPISAADSPVPFSPAMSAVASSHSAASPAKTMNHNAATPLSVDLDATLKPETVTGDESQTQDESQTLLKGHPPANSLMAGPKMAPPGVVKPLTVRTSMHQRMPGIQPANLESPYDPGYFSVGSSSMRTSSHYSSSTELSLRTRSVSPPGNLEQQSVNDKVQTYLDQSVPSGQHGQPHGGQQGKVPLGSMSVPNAHPSHMRMPQQMGAPYRNVQPGSFSQSASVPQQSDGNLTARIPGHSTGPRLTSPTKVRQGSCDQMAPPMGPPQPGYRQQQVTPNMYPNQQSYQQGQYSDQQAPASYYAQRSGSQPTSPKKRRQEMADSSMQQNYGTPQHQMSAPMGMGSNMSTPVPGQFTPQHSGPRLQMPQGPVSTPSFNAGQPMRNMFAGQPIKNEYIQRQQVKRTSSYRERISPEKPQAAIQVQNEHGETYTKIPPVTAQHGFIQHLINDKSNAFRSHSLFPLLRDLIIADMNFYSPAFPFALIANLPQDFDRLLSNFMNRNPQSANRRNNQSVDNVVLDALRYAHKALIEKIQQQRKDRGEQPDKAVSAIEDFCERFDKAIKNTLPSADVPPPSSGGPAQQQAMPQPQMYPPQVAPSVPPSLAYQPAGVPASQFASPGKRRYLHSTRTQSPCRVRRDLMTNQQGPSVTVDLTGDSAQAQPSLGPAYQNNTANSQGQFSQNVMSSSGQNMPQYPSQQMGGGQFSQNVQPTMGVNGAMSQSNPMSSMGVPGAIPQSNPPSSSGVHCGMPQSNPMSSMGVQGGMPQPNPLPQVGPGGMQHQQQWRSSNPNLSQHSRENMPPQMQSNSMLPQNSGHQQQSFINNAQFGANMSGPMAYSGQVQNSQYQQPPVRPNTGYESPNLNCLPYQAPNSNALPLSVPRPLASDNDRPSSRGSSNGSSHGNDSNGSAGQAMSQAQAGGKRTQVLPKEAVSIMLEWLRSHQEKPYPSDEEKEMLMSRTSLTINQINYWFTNARRRILPKWTLQRILEEQARANGEDPTTVKVKGSAQEARAVTKELLKGNTLESFLSKSKQEPSSVDQFLEHKIHMRRAQNPMSQEPHRQTLTGGLQGQGYGQGQTHAYPYGTQSEGQNMMPYHTDLYPPVDNSLVGDYPVQTNNMMHNMSSSTLNTNDLTGLL